jgi:hypothetical protein
MFLLVVWVLLAGMLLAQRVLTWQWQLTASCSAMCTASANHA